MGRLERMKHGNGIKNRDDRSIGVEILMTDTFTKITRRTPKQQLNKQREENEIDSSGKVVHQPEQLVVYYESIKRELKRIPTVCMREGMEGER